MRSYQRHEQDAFYFVHDTKLGLQRNHLHFQNHLGCSEVQDLHLSLLAPSLTLCPIYPQGKFIRIHFGATGKLASADIETCEYAGSLAPSPESSTSAFIPHWAPSSVDISPLSPVSVYICLWTLLFFSL